MGKTIQRKKLCAVKVNQHGNNIKRELPFAGSNPPRGGGENKKMEENEARKGRYTAAGS